jgi:hypothetical protein
MLKRSAKGWFRPTNGRRESNKDGNRMPSLPKLIKYSCLETVTTYNYTLSASSNIDNLLNVIPASIANLKTIINSQPIKVANGGFGLANGQMEHLKRCLLLIK